MTVAAPNIAPKLTPADLLYHAGRGGIPASSGTEDQLMEQAQKWVSQTFFGTLLKQMRNSPFKSEIFSGGRGGEAFGPLYDQHLADRMARASGQDLARSIVRRLRRPDVGPRHASPSDSNDNTFSIAA